ncbi:MAG: cysteine hydrolase [Clostridiales bacterium]|nr:cysteine hydrolase [Clostridiales bacterium]
MKKLLIVVDFQNDFVDGALGFPKARELEAVILDKIKEYRANGDEVAFTFDTHGEDYLDTLEGKNLPVIHCLKHSYGWRLYGGLQDAILESDKRFYKETFGSVELFDHLRENSYSRIELAGLVSNICVLTNAALAKTAQPQTEVIIDKKAVASFDDEMNEKCLDILKGIHVSVIS